MTESARLLVGAEYPARFHDLDTPPESVFLVGELPRMYSVAIVGTRNPTPSARDFARRLGRDLAREGVAIFSGGAEGIDTAAHEGALDAGGVTVVVAPSSFDRPFPKQNGALFERIVRARGGFLTTHPPGTPANNTHFFPRNKLLAALSDAVVVVQTRLRGGGRNAARYARELGRPVLVVPFAPWMKGCGGYVVELRLGARTITGADQVLEAIGRVPRPLDAGLGDDQVPSPPSNGALPRQPTLPGLTASEAPRGHRPAGRLPLEGLQEGESDRNAVVELLALGPLWPDEICRTLGLPAQRVTGLLLTLTLESVVVSQPSGRVSLVSL